MKLLLDSHIWLWSFDLPERLSRRVRAELADSRNELWLKGETSGHTQQVREIRVDCDADAVLLKVQQRGGAACHEGYRSCFFRRVDSDRWQIVEQRVVDPEQVYTKRS